MDRLGFNTPDPPLLQVPAQQIPQALMQPGRVLRVPARRTVPQTEKREKKVYAILFGDGEQRYLNLAVAYDLESAVTKSRVAILKKYKHDMNNLTVNMWVMKGASALGEELFY